jgi:hypothetical protein
LIPSQGGNLPGAGSQPQRAVSNRKLVSLLSLAQAVIEALCACRQGVWPNVAFTDWCFAKAVVWLFIARRDCLVVRDEE